MDLTKCSSLKKNFKQASIPLYLPLKQLPNVPFPRTLSSSTSSKFFVINHGFWNIYVLQCTASKIQKSIIFFFCFLPFIKIAICYLLGDLTVIFKVNYFSVLLLSLLHWIAKMLRVFFDLCDSSFAYFFSFSFHSWSTEMLTAGFF